MLKTGKKPWEHLGECNIDWHLNHRTELTAMAGSFMCNGLHFGFHRFKRKLHKSTRKAGKGILFVMWFQSPGVREGRRANRQNIEYILDMMARSRDIYTSWLGDWGLSPELLSSTSQAAFEHDPTWILKLWEQNSGAEHLELSTRATTEIRQRSVGMGSHLKYLKSSLGSLILHQHLEIISFPIILKMREDSKGGNSILCNSLRLY